MVLMFLKESSNRNLVKFSGKPLIKLTEDFS